MSNPIVADEGQGVDDVLASIRKLVSEEAKARLQPAQREDAPVPIGQPDTLMLTPELKVAPGPTPAPLKLDAPVAANADTPPNPPAPFHDEVALRALVSEMLREELQGELGNRITRNVRKLIQREVEAALKKRG